MPRCRFVIAGYLYVVLTLHFEAKAEPNSGGFFDRNYVDQGFFDEPAPPSPAATKETPESTASPQPTEAPALLSPAPVSAAEAASEIIKSSRESIEAVKNISSNPESANQLRKTLDEVKISLDRQLGKDVPSSPPVNLPNLSVAQTVEEIARELSLGVIRQPAKVTLVVSAKPKSYLSQALDRLLVAKNRGAEIEALYVVGYHEELSLNFPLYEEQRQTVEAVINETLKDGAQRQHAVSQLQESRSRKALLLEKLNLKQQLLSVRSYKSLIDEFHLTRSPAWIITSDKRTVVLQGGYQPHEFLDEQGFLLNELPEDTRGGSNFAPPDKVKGAEALLTVYHKIERALIEPPPEGLRVIKNCTRPRARRLKTGPATFGTFFMLDALVYAGDDPEQQQLVSGYSGFKVPYRAGKLDGANPLTPFLSNLPIRCLPTRVRYVNEDGSQFLELLQGELSVEVK